MYRRICCLLFAVLPAVAAAESDLGLSYVRTKDLDLIYFDSLKYLVPHAVRTFTNSLTFQRKIFGWEPSEPTIVLLKDLSDYGAAVTNTLPHDRVVIDVAPISHAFETFPASERLYTLMNHELVHVTQGDMATAEDRRWRNFFGGKVRVETDNPETLLYSYLTSPRNAVPRWWAEGGAVFMETWKDGGIGRAQGGYDEMVFRAMVRDDAPFYDPLGLASRGVQTSFQITADAYLYGTRFFTWLAYAYSPEKVVAWIKRDEGSKAYYADQFQHVFGLPLETAWQHWIAFEHEFQKRNLEEVRQHPITPYKPLAGSAMGSISRMYYDDATGMLYAGFVYPGFIDHVGALDTRTGKETPLTDIKGGLVYKVTSLAYDPASGTAFFTNNNEGLRDLMEVNVHTGATRMLIEGARIGDLAFNPVDRSLMGVRTSNGLSELVRIPYPYRGWQMIHRFPYESVPYDLDISPDGQLLSASMSELNADQYVRVWRLADVLKGDLRPASQFRFGQSIPESFVFSPDGKYLYGSSYYTGVSNIFRYDVATGRVDAVSNAETGFFRPVPLKDGRLIVLVYSGKGFLPATIDPKPIEDVSAITFLGTEVAEKHPIVKTWQVPPPGTVDYDKLVVKQGAYSPLHEMGFDNAYPVLQGYKNAIGLGYQFNFSDPILFSRVGVTAAYTPLGHVSSDERSHFDITGNYLSWRGSLAWNPSDFYDLFGPTKTSRKGFAAKIGYDDFLIYDKPRLLTLSYDLGYFDHIDTLPNAQNVGTGFTRLETVQVGLHYTFVRKSLGFVDEEKGIKWDAVVKASHIATGTTTQLRGNFDYGFQLPIAHSSIWLRSSAGVGTGSRDNPVASYYFGGFGNNYVDKGSVKRYRDYGSLPGFGIDEIGGQSFLRELGEWDLPPWVFESVGTPGFYLNWLRPAVFATGLWTDPGNKTLRKSYADLGMQADLRFHVLHRYDMTLSFGYAVGFQKSRRSGDEFMISLKIL
ncbi:MAG: hypothetical protein KGJ99_06245 [Betaproteobacteria bacterium]|nr:hypothetical protein [Betaproteobacteria bacterium]MDE2209307.1 hypothetical protein [Betaproteobacteria bacterium]